MPFLHCGIHLVHRLHIPGSELVITAAKSTGVDHDGAIHQRTASHGHPARRRLDDLRVGEKQRQGETGSNQHAGEETTEICVGTGKVSYRLRARL
jgi:hypothetical protein